MSSLLSSLGWDADSLRKADAIDLWILYLDIVSDFDVQNFSIVAES
jgi:hypothetical protein